MKKVSALIADGGDGSACIRWFESVDHAMALSSCDKYCEEFGLNEGSPEIITVPDDWKPDSGWDDKHFTIDSDNEDDM